MAVGSTVLLAGWLGLATTTMVAGNAQTDAQLAAKQAELARMTTQIAAMKSDVTALKGSVATTAAKIEARQAFLATLLSGKQQDLKKLAAMLPRAEGTAADVATAADLLPGAQHAAVLEPFRRIESEQLAFVDKATAAAEARYQETQALVRRLGLDPNRLMAASEFGMGGPYIPASGEALRGADPKFKDLYLNWKRLTALEAALASIPSFMPVKTYSYTSGFGVRYDPFNGGAAMHAGVDMAGAQGEPIYAAASGRIITAGRQGGYGNLVEIEHGKGLATRYGHLSQILVTSGATVKQGQLIGRMGSTGRSTGTHLHYEVRIDGRPVNPRPYLEASAFVLAAQSRAVQGVPAPEELAAGGSSPIEISGFGGS